MCIFILSPGSSSLKLAFPQNHLDKCSKTDNQGCVFFKLTFNWRIIALQWCVGFHNTTWISCRLKLGYFGSVQFSSVAQSSDSLRPHGPQHARLPCPSPTTTACSNSCPLSWWCYLIPCCPLSSCLQSSPASGFLMSQFFVSGGQSIGVSASASVLPMNIQDWFPLGLTGLILQSILWLLAAKNQLIRKDTGAGKDWRQKEEGITEDEMARQHHRLTGHEFEQTRRQWKTGKPGML